jgi:hypothetical protein
MPLSKRTSFSAIIIEEMIAELQNVLLLKTRLLYLLFLRDFIITLLFSYSQLIQLEATLIE